MTVAAGMRDADEEAPSGPGGLSRGAALSIRLDGVRGVGLAAFVALALLLGGGGAVTPPGFTAAIRLAALATILLTATAMWSRHLDDRARPMLALGIVTAITLAGQLVPLPPALWQALPGRELATDIRLFAGAGGRWLPFSLDPDATRDAALSFIAPAAAFLGILYAGARARLSAVRVVLAVAAVDLVLSVWQFTSGAGADLTPYVTAHRGSAIGVFANRNHNADLLLVAALLGAALVLVDRGQRLAAVTRPAMLAILAVAMLGVFITASRTGILLGSVSIMGVLFLMSSRGREGFVPWGRTLILLLVAAVLLGTAAAVLRDNAVARTILARFEASDDPRFVFWPDVTYAIGQFWPGGTGTGTFATVFKTVERLDAVSEFYVNHAHNDYLEVALTLGLWGVALMSMYMVALARALYQVLRLRDPGPIDPLPVAAGLAIFILLLHSLVDYPLRMQSLAVLMALCSGLLFRPAIPHARLVPIAP